MLSLLFAVLAIHAAPPPQQEITPRELGAIVDVVLDSLLQPDKRLGGELSVRERGIRFDVALADTTIRRGSASKASLAALRMSRVVVDGNRALTADCDQLGRGPCAALGNQALVTVKRINDQETKPGQLKLRVSVRWSVRGRELEHRQRNPRLQGYGVDVTMTRSESGTWRITHVRDFAVG